MSSLLNLWNSKSKKIQDDTNKKINNQDETKQENIKSPENNIINETNEIPLLSFSQVSSSSQKNLNNSIDEIDQTFTQDSIQRYSKEFATKKDYINHIKKHRLITQDPPLYKTELPDPSIIELKLNMLVWAPYYKLKNTYWCARLLIGQTEIRKTTDITEPYPWEIEGEDQAVVEFLCSVNDSVTTTRLLKVEKSKIKPFYGDELINSVNDISKWDDILMEKLGKKIQSYYTKAGVSDRIFTEIKNKANEFIQEALKNDDPSMYLQSVQNISKQNNSQSYSIDTSCHKNNIQSNNTNTSSIKNNTQNSNKTNTSSNKNLNRSSNKKKSTPIINNKLINKQLKKGSNGKTNINVKKRILCNTQENEIYSPRKSSRIK